MFTRTSLSEEIHLYGNFADNFIVDIRGVWNERWSKCFRICPPEWNAKKLRALAAQQAISNPLLGMLWHVKPDGVRQLKLWEISVALCVQWMWQDIKLTSMRTNWNGKNLSEKKELSDWILQLMQQKWCPSASSRATIYVLSPPIFPSQKSVKKCSETQTKNRSSMNLNHEVDELIKLSLRAVTNSNQNLGFEAVPFWA